MFIELENNKLINVDNVFEIYCVEATDFDHCNLNYHLDKPGLIFICDKDLTGVEFNNYDEAYNKIIELQQKYNFILDTEDCVRIINPNNIFELNIKENEIKLKDKEILISFSFKNLISSEFNTSISNAINIKNLLLGNSKIDEFNNLSYSDKIKQLRTETDINFLSQILPLISGEMKKIAERQLARL